MVPYGCCLLYADAPAHTAHYTLRFFCRLCRVMLLLVSVFWCALPPPAQNMAGAGEAAPPHTHTPHHRLPHRAAHTPPYPTPSPPLPHTHILHAARTTAPPPAAPGIAAPFDSCRRGAAAAAEAYHTLLRDTAAAFLMSYAFAACYIPTHAHALPASRLPFCSSCRAHYPAGYYYLHLPPFSSALYSASRCVSFRLDGWTVGLFLRFLPLRFYYLPPPPLLPSFLLSHIPASILAAFFVDVTVRSSTALHAPATHACHPITAHAGRLVFSAGSFHHPPKGQGGCLPPLLHAARCWTPRCVHMGLCWQVFSCLQPAVLYYICHTL